VRDLLPGFDLARYHLTGWAIAYFACAGLVLSLVVAVMTGRRRRPARRRSGARSRGRRGWSAPWP
jgi:hypothetical protein